MGIKLEGVSSEVEDYLSTLSPTGTVVPLAIEAQRDKDEGK